jgi:hypothetical protein
MAEVSSVAALRVADEAFLVASTIERCPKTMMLRELVVNAIEAARNAVGERLVELTTRHVGGVPKLCIFNTGPGLSAQELYRICDLASSLGKTTSLDGNFGMGAKVASLPSNKHGLRYRSCRDGVVSEVILGQRDGVYGRLRRVTDDGAVTEVLDATKLCSAEGGYDLTRDWTEVVLFGNRADQDTAIDPYGGNPAMPAGWVVDLLMQRFFRLGVSVTVRLAPSVTGRPAAQILRTVSELDGVFTRRESVRTPSGISIHYCYDASAVSAAPLTGTAAKPGAMACAVYRDEMYDVRSGARWVMDAPSFGVPFGARHVSIFVELPDDYLVRPEAYRQYLRFRGGDQRQVFVHEYAPLVRACMPEWLTRIIRGFGPDRAEFADEMAEELRKLLAELGVPLSQAALPGLLPEGLRPSVAVAAPVPLQAPPPPNAGAVPPPRPPQPRYEPPPEIIGLDCDEMIAERGLIGRAAKYYEGAHQLFVNLRYPAIGALAEQLEAEHADAGHEGAAEARRAAARAVAEWAIMRRVARALVYSFSKKAAGWSADDVRRAQSPEAMSLAADDWRLMLDVARRRMENRLAAEAPDEVTLHSKAA